MIDDLEHFIQNAPNQGTISSLFAKLDKHGALDAYESLIKALEQGKFPNMTLQGAMQKLDRPYRIDDVHSHSHDHTLLASTNSSPAITLVAADRLGQAEAEEPTLSAAQLHRFVTDGYLHIQGITDIDMIEECLTILNRQLGTPGAICPGGAQGNGFGKLQGAITQHITIRSLVSGKVLDAVNALMGGGESESGSGSGACCIDNLTAQIAHRFPQVECIGERHEINQGKGWHTDGLRRGRVHPFSVLLGIALSDVGSEWNGNLLVWPGTHRLVHKCLQDQYGAIDCTLLQKLLDNEQAVGQGQGQGQDQRRRQGAKVHVQPKAEWKATAASASTNVEETGSHDNAPADLPALGKPLQLCLSMGDIVLLHPDLAHAGGANFGPHIRTMLYFRLKSRTASANASGDGNVDRRKYVRTWEAVSQEHLQDMWSDFSPEVQSAAKNII